MTRGLVYTTDLTKTYGAGEAEVRALRGVTIDFSPRQFTAIMGPSGSGKSTLMHCLAGLDRPTSGEVVVADRVVSAMNERELTQLRRTTIGFVFQAFNLVPTLTAAENVTLPADIAHSAVDRDWFDTIIAALGLTDRLDHRPSQLSGGQQQRVACARALVTKPAVVFADEPTGNLDTAAAREVLTFLRRSVEDFGQTVLMVTHDPAAAAHAHRVVFLADGQIAGDLAEPTADTVIGALKDVAARVGAGAVAPAGEAG
jgi:putative ABC transport system ATP-binding protein